MTDRTRIPWLRILAEGVVIVSSILIAFAADRLWEQRQDAEAEAILLVNLAAEVQENLDVLASNREGHHRSEQAAVRLIRIVDGDVPLFAEPFDSLLWAAFLDASTFEASTGVLDGLIATGQLTRLRDPELRDRLASWHAQLDDTAEEEGWIVNDIRTLWRPYLVESGLVRPAERVYDFFRDIGPGSRAYDFARAIEDPEFESLVLLRLEDERIALGEYDDLVEDTERILELIQAAIAER